MRICSGDLDDARVVALLGHHVARARAETAPGSAHALDLSELRVADVRFWAVWDAGSLLAVGALTRVAPDHGEIKSMHVAESARRRAVGSALLRHIVAEARALGFVRLSLETGSWPYFAPAVALYRRHGFVDVPPFGAYRQDPNSLFLSLDLA